MEANSIQDIFHRHNDFIPTTYDLLGKIKYISIAIITAPIKLILGLAQTILFALLISIRGCFYKTGFKGYFIDTFVLMKDNYNSELYDRYNQEIENGKLKNATIVKIGDDKQFETIKFEHPTEKKKWIVYVPGVGGSFITSIQTIKKIHEAGYNVICANTYGVGNSAPFDKAPPSVETLVAPAMAAYNQLNANGEEVMFWGHSMGGAIAAEAAGMISEEVDVIIDRSFNRFIDASKHVPKYFYFPFNRLLAWIIHRTLPFDTEVALSKIKGSVTIITHAGDEVIDKMAAAVNCKLEKLEKLEEKKKIAKYTLTDNKWFEEKEKKEFVDKSAGIHIGEYKIQSIEYILNKLHK